MDSFHCKRCSTFDSTSQAAHTSCLHTAVSTKVVQKSFFFFFFWTTFVEPVECKAIYSHPLMKVNFMQQWKPPLKAFCDDNRRYR